MSFARKILLLLALVSSSASAVSRIGGGKVINDQLGFEAQIPATFPLAEVDPHGNVRLRGIVPSMGTPASSLIFVLPVANFLPELAQFPTPGQTDLWFAQRGWAQRDSKPPCVRVYVLRKDSDITVALLWGPAKGILVSGQLGPNVVNGINTLANTLSVQPESCAWSP